MEEKVKEFADDLIVKIGSMQKSSLDYEIPEYSGEEFEVISHQIDGYNRALSELEQYIVEKRVKTMSKTRNEKISDFIKESIKKIGGEMMSEKKCSTCIHSVENTEYVRMDTRETYYECRINPPKARSMITDGVGSGYWPTMISTSDPWCSKHSELGQKEKGGEKVECQ